MLPVGLVPTMQSICPMYQYLCELFDESHSLTLFSIIRFCTLYLYLSFSMASHRWRPENAFSLIRTEPGTAWLSVMDNLHKMVPVYNKS